jgi:tRNA (guanine37-N1)-methyltransferase
MKASSNARGSRALELKLHQLRDWTHDRHKTVDDRPFGGGPGMLLKPEPLFEAVESLRRRKDAGDFAVARRAQV